MFNRSKSAHVSPSSVALLEAKPSPVIKGQHSAPLYENAEECGIETSARFFNRPAPAPISTMERICEKDRELLCSGRGGTPANHLVAIIEEFGLSVKREALPGSQLGRLDLVRGLVTVDPSQSAFEENFSLAHELGHWRLHRHLLERGEQLTAVHEEQANTYAAVFLLPTALLETERHAAHVVGELGHRMEDFNLHFLSRKYSAPLWAVRGRVQKVCPPTENPNARPCDELSPALVAVAR